MAAVVLALIADSGAVVTPVIVGMGQGLDNPNFSDVLQIAQTASLIDLGVASFLPLIMVLILTRFFGHNKSWREGLGAWKFALLGGFAYTLTAYGVVLVLGPEFPAILGGLSGLIITVLAAKYLFLTPKTVWLFQTDHSQFSAEAPNEKAPGLVDNLTCLASEPANHPKLSLIKAWFPYLLIAVLLV